MLKELFFIFRNEVFKIFSHQICHKIYDLFFGSQRSKSFKILSLQEIELWILLSKIENPWLTGKSMLSLKLMQNSITGSAVYGY